jgi:hypothetical protein
VSWRIQWQSVISFIPDWIELVKKLVDVVLAWLLKRLIPYALLGLRVIKHSVMDIPAPRWIIVGKRSSPDDLVNE